ncbi:MAG: site-specific integrase, partial [Akkermansiaceae bacterium]
MASLRKRKGSNVWQAQFYVLDAETKTRKQVRQSTGQTNRKKAMEVAVDLERVAQGTVQAGTDKARQARAILEEAVREIERETFTGLSARKYLGRLLEISTGEEMKSYTVQTWGEEWLARKEKNSSKATIARYRSHLNKFLAWIGDERKAKPLESVTTQHVREWREELQGNGLAGKTVQSYLKDIGAVYRAAIAEGLVWFNPF